MSQMSCPECNSRDNHIRETREHPTYNWVRRYRCCRECLHGWATMEMPEGDFDIGALD
jgi:transcriptional regulator NrdR family protein